VGFIYLKMIDSRHMQENKTSIVIAIIGVIAIVAGAWFFFSGGSLPSLGDTSKSSDVIARVNGEDITREQLEQIETQFTAGQGIDVASLDATTRKQLQEDALDRLISSLLIQQAVADSGIITTEAEIDVQLEAIKTQFQDDAQFQEVLVAQNLSEDDVREQIAKELPSQRYLEQTLDLASITVSEEEIQARYEQEVVTTENVPALEDVRAQIEALIIQEKQQELLAMHVQELRASAEIEILI